jgi:hypothetical protein
MMRNRNHNLGVALSMAEQKKAKAKGRKIGRDRKKGERYRARIGKPLGPGVPGNKAGRNHVRQA